MELAKCLGPAGASGQQLMGVSVYEHVSHGRPASLMVLVLAMASADANMAASPVRITTPAKRINGR